jgi:hypothetical protein
MPMPKTCTIQTPNFRGRYHKQYLADPVPVACEYSISKGSNAEGTLQILSGWLAVPTNTDITTESIITIEGIQTTVKPWAKFTADSGAITVNAVIYAL